MTLGPWRVGDLPVDPIELTVTRPGDPAPMSGFTSAMFYQRAPDGAVTSWPGAIDGNTVTAQLPAIITQAGQYAMWLVLTGPAGSEQTHRIYFIVRPPLIP